MRVEKTDLPGVLVLQPRVFGDERGFFTESFNHWVFTETTGLAPEFVQDSHSRSVRGVLRGLHYQVQRPQGKLIRVVLGEIFDVAVDLRRGSPGFGRWVGVGLSGENHRQLWIPPGFAHGFLVLSEVADVLYKSTSYYAPEHERCIAWDDPTLAVSWPLAALGLERPLLSGRDRAGAALGRAELPP